MIRAIDLFGRTWPSIELTTSARVWARVDLHRTGKLCKTGMVKQEEVDLAMFNATPFGAAYDNASALGK